MSGFKLIAIRPLVGCDGRFLKNLKEGEIYRFYNNITFKSGDVILDVITDSNKEKDINEIFIHSSQIENLFSFKKGKKNYNINISAIVGNNGSGKSALTELLLYTFFTISNKLRYVKRENFIFDEIESFNFKNDLEEIKKGLKVELYYLTENSIKCIRIDENKIFFYNTIKNKGETIVDRKNHINLTRRDQLTDFFYSMFVNYSLYSFNSNEIGIWIKSIFHKNDGYQMPVVVNPYRDKGIIDVNTETFLTRSRFLSNIISIKEYKKIDSTLEVNKVAFYRDKNKINRLYELPNNTKERYSEQFIQQFRTKITIPLFIKMFGYSDNEDYLEAHYPLEEQDSSNIKNLVELYLINKIISLPYKYSNFDEFKFKLDNHSEIEDNFDLNSILIGEFVQKIYEDRSHVTIKIRQSLNFLRYNIFNVEKYDSYFEVKFDEIVGKIGSLRKNNLFTDVVDYLPPPVFFSEIEFKDGGLFRNLSSGQRQSIYSLNSIIYHLKNIDSVHKSSTSKKIKKYSSVNLILDEIELYFHPTYQKNYINNLLFLIENCELEFIKNINIIFLTHSPFILSDIPNNNVLKLEEGNQLTFKIEEQTFGANINDILANDFFLKSGFLGEFVKNKINSLIDFLDKDWNSNKEWNEKNAKEFIEIIGEPLIRLELRELYFNKFYTNEQIEIDQIDKEIERLKRIKEKKITNNDINKRTNT